MGATGNWSDVAVLGSELFVLDEDNDEDRNTIHVFEIVVDYARTKDVPPLLSFRLLRTIRVIVLTPIQYLMTFKGRLYAVEDFQQAGRLIPYRAAFRIDTYSGESTIARHPIDLVAFRWSDYLVDDDGIVYKCSADGDFRLYDGSDELEPIEDNDRVLMPIASLEPLGRQVVANGFTTSHAIVKDADGCVIHLEHVNGDGRLRLYDLRLQLVSELGRLPSFPFDAQTVKMWLDERRGLLYVGRAPAGQLVVNAFFVYKVIKYLPPKKV